MSNKNKIGLKIILTTAITMVSCFMVMGFFLFLRISDLDKKQYNDKLASTRKVTDAAIDTYFDGLEGSIKVFGNLNVIRQDNSGITSYVNKKDPLGKGGKIPMDSTKFGSYESAVYKEAKSFVDSQDGVIDMSISLESNGGYVSYPTSARKEGYDPRGRSWYKAAKEQAGKVDFSDAYAASDGTKSIVVSMYFNDLYGKPRGVVSMDANLTLLSDLLAVNNKGPKTEKVILVDRTGTIIVDQLDETKEFTSINERGIAVLNNFEYGNEFTINTTLNGKNYQVRAVKSENKFIPLTYIYVIPMSVVNAADNTLARIIIIATIIALLFTNLIMFLTSRTITKPLVSAITVLKNISEGEGDLTSRIPIIGHDETTDLANYFNNTFEKIDNTMKKVVDESKVMENVATDLSNSMESTAATINQINTHISEIKNEVINQSAGVEETTATMEQITNNIEKLNRNIESQSESVAKSSSAVEEMVANIRSVNDILNKNQVAVNDLTNSAENGKEVVNRSVQIIKDITDESAGLLEAVSIIQNIAEQTNLLAMNAAIEAAHAGESGKGFAVVADEIRKLAEDSGVQGSKISEVLGGLNNLISDVNESSQAMLEQFNTIYDNTKTVRNQEDVIKSAMDEQSAGGAQILEAMQSINDITSEVRSGAEIMYRGGKEIMVEMNKLAEVTQEVSDRINEMTSGINNVNTQVQQINEKTDINVDSINKVINEINKFKV